MFPSSLGKEGRKKAKLETLKLDHKPDKPMTSKLLCFKVFSVLITIITKIYLGDVTKYLPK